MPPFPKINLTEDQQKKLVRQIKDMIAAGDEFHGQWEELHNIYLDQYLCRPEFKVKPTPWKAASNLVLPLGRVIQDGIMSQLHDAFFSNRPVVKVIAQKPRSMAGADSLSAYYGNYLFDKVIPLPVIGNDWNFCTCLDGTGVVRPRWDRSRFLRRSLVPDLTPVYGDPTVQQDLFGFPVSGPRPIIEIRSEIKELVTVERVERPALDVMDLSNLYIAPDTVNGLQYPDCPWYYIRVHLTWPQLLARRQMGYEGIDEKLKSQLGRRSTGRREDTLRADENLSQGTVLDTLEVIELYCRLTLPANYTYEEDGKPKKGSQTFDDEDGHQEEVVITYFPATDTISRIIPLWRVDPRGRRPDVPNFFNRIPGRFYGQGIQAKMSQLNDLSNTMVNQTVDWGTLMSIPFYFYMPALTGELPDLMEMSPGKGIPVGDTRGVLFPRMNGDRGFGMDMLYLSQQWAERDGNITDQNIGRMPEKSANKTFRGMALVQQLQNVAFRRFASVLSRGYLEALYSIHELHKRYAPDETVFRVTDGRGYRFDEHRVRRSDFMEEIDFEIVLNPDRQADQQVAQTLFQLMISIPFVAQNPASVRILCKQLYDAIGSNMGRHNFDEIWPEEMTQQIIMAQQQQIRSQAGPSPFRPAQPPQMGPQAGPPMGQGGPPMGGPESQIPITEKPLDDDTAGVIL